MNAFPCDAGHYSDKGPHRRRNEDVAFSSLDDGIYMVADGLGGAAPGDRASRVATDILTAVLRSDVTSRDVVKDLLPDGFVTPKNHHDSFHTGAGILVRPPLPIDLEVMTGFHYDNSASPDNTVEVGAPSFDLAAYHIGGRWRINDRFRVALFYAHYWYFERTTTDSITSPPTNFVGSGYTNMVTVVLEGRLGTGIGMD